MRTCLSNVLFMAAIFVFGLNAVVHFATFWGVNWQERYSPVYLVVSILTFIPATFAEVVRSRVPIFTIWPKHFILSMPWKARLAVGLIWVYFFFSLYSFITALGSGKLSPEQADLVTERHTSAFLMLFSFMAAIYYRYTLPKAGSAVVTDVG